MEVWPPCVPPNAPRTSSAVDDRLIFHHQYRKDRPFTQTGCSMTMTPSLGARVFLAVCLWLLLGACATPRVDEFEAAVGRLTQDELTRQFGYPQRLKKLASGTEVWEYEFLAGGSRCVGYRVFFDDDRRSTQWTALPCRADP